MMPNCEQIYAASKVYFEISSHLNSRPCASLRVEKQQIRKQREYRSISGGEAMVADVLASDLAGQRSEAQARLHGSGHARPERPAAAD